MTDPVTRLLTSHTHSFSVIWMIMLAYLSLLLLCTFSRTSSFTVACSGLTPISEISTRAFMAYSWFGPPLGPLAGVYLVRDSGAHWSSVLRRLAELAIR